MTSFADLGLTETLLRAIATEGYHQPTPIQSKVIPQMMAGRDVLGIAQTGTGKTAAFVLPLLHALAASRADRVPRSCHGLIVSPTRELASQIADEISRYSRHLRPSVAVIVGGVKAGPQIKSLSRGVDIVVATPGRLLDHAASGALDLHHTKKVVLDEADQMLDLGFLPAIRKIMARVPKARQTVMMSATMPREIGKLAEQFLDAPARVSVAPVSRPIAEIAQRVIAVEPSAKRLVLAEILAQRDVSRAIVFTRTKRGADKVQRHLQSAGLSASAIHGNKSQGQRERALASFRNGQSPILVATDIAARGIHVDEVSHVVNFELPDVPEVYVHRIGRTARAGRSGTAISLCSPDERKLLRGIERLTGTKLAGHAPAAGPPQHGPEAMEDGTARVPGVRESAGRVAADRPRKRARGTGRDRKRPARTTSPAAFTEPMERGRTRAPAGSTAS